MRTPFPWQRRHRWRTITRALQERGLEFEPGLTLAEIKQAEQTYGLRFPPDLREFLQCALPVKEPPPPSGVIGNRRSNFPNWRSDSDEVIRKKLAWPAEGICFDIAHADFWKPSWEPRPDDLLEAFRVARAAIAAAPTLIPIYGHRYISAKPRKAGNPVFSVYQTDIIYYGMDLASYLAHEFDIDCPAWAATEPHPIEFWDWVVQYNNRRF